MTISFLTLSLNSMPCIGSHLRIMDSLTVPWRWVVIEGAARPVGSTAWCKPIGPGVSTDGTHEYLKEIAAYHPRVRHFHRPEWQGKDEMVNFGLKYLDQPGLLWQLDSDEMWTSKQIETVVQAFKLHPSKQWARFYCRYFFGPNLVVKRTERDTYGNREGEWLRVWRYDGRQRFVSHEPPVLAGCDQSREGFTREDTERWGCVFRHEAYYSEKQAAFKEAFYGYAGAVNAWRNLQRNTVWPTLARDFLPWVKDMTVIEPVFT